MVYLYRVPTLGHDHFTAWFDLAIEIDNYVRRINILIAQNELENLYSVQAVKLVIEVFIPKKEI